MGDYGWNFKVGTTYGLYGGNCNYGTMDKVGVFYCNLNDTVDTFFWTVGAIIHPGNSLGGLRIIVLAVV